MSEADRGTAAAAVTAAGRTGPGSEVMVAECFVRAASAARNREAAMFAAPYNQLVFVVDHHRAVEHTAWRVGRTAVPASDETAGREYADWDSDLSAVVLQVAAAAAVWTVRTQLSVDVVLAQRPERTNFLAKASERISEFLPQPLPTLFGC